jgi:hypothetical protein
MARYTAAHNKEIKMDKNITVYDAVKMLYKDLDDNKSTNLAKFHEHTGCTDGSFKYAVSLIGAEFPNYEAKK